MKTAVIWVAATINVGNYVGGSGKYINLSKPITIKSINLTAYVIDDILNKNIPVEAVGYFYQSSGFGLLNANGTAFIDVATGNRLVSNRIEFDNRKEYPVNFYLEPLIGAGDQIFLAVQWYLPNIVVGNNADCVANIVINYEEKE